jgi:dUTP pyrophosphatase
MLNLLNVNTANIIKATARYYIIYYYFIFFKFQQVQEAAMLATTTGSESKVSGIVKFNRLTTDAVVPTASTQGSAGMDVASRVQVVVPAKEWVTIPTGIAMEIPGDCYARIAPRSGLAFHHGLMINAGVIDSDYRGEVKVIMYNPGSTAYHIAAGDKIAQLIFERIYAPSSLFVVVSDGTESSALSSSERGGQGFGSTERRALTN